MRDEWRARVVAEYRSCAAAHHLTLWLIQIGASPDLIRAGLAIADDELSHAELSQQVYAAAGGEGGAHVPREHLDNARHPGEPLERDVLRVCVEMFCLGETVAVPLFRQMQRTAAAPARPVLDRILRDEVRHRDFGWTLLAWLLQTAEGPALRALAEDELPRMFQRIADSYARPGDERVTAMSAQERAWGLMPPAAYGAVLQRSIERDYLPRLRRLGFDEDRCRAALRLAVAPPDAG